MPGCLLPCQYDSRTPTADSISKTVADTGEKLVGLEWCLRLAHCIVRKAPLDQILEAHCCSVLELLGIDGHFRRLSRKNIGVSHRNIDGRAAVSRKRLGTSSSSLPSSTIATHGRASVTLHAGFDPPGRQSTDTVQRPPDQGSRIGRS